MVAADAEFARTAADGAKENAQKLGFKIIFDRSYPPTTTDFAPIMRAGLGMLDGMLELAPSARVAHIGLYREPKTLKAVEYYFKAPSDVAERLVIVIDPMLATGHTAVAAIDRLKETGVKDIRFVCVLAAPQGVDVLTGHHPDVQIWAAAVDERLDDHAYIVPGLGDAGDRMYGTK